MSNHAQGLYAMNGGRITAGRPALGSWLTYGLGSETDELPAYMVLSHPGGLPTFQGEHFTNGWLPSLYQGTAVRAGLGGKEIGQGHPKRTGANAAEKMASR